MGNLNVDERWGKQVRSQLQMFLWNREYRMNYVADNGVVTAPNGMKFTIAVVYCTESHIATVNITSKNWRDVPDTKGEYAQAVVLIEDFFKLHNTIWYYLETLTLQEVDAIDEHGRAITPIQIKHQLENWDKEKLPPKPELSLAGEYDNQATNIYHGSKSSFKSILDFWISCLTWIDYDGIDLADLSFHKDAQHFKQQSGACIPISTKGHEKLLAQIAEHVPEVNAAKLKTMCLMGKAWNDKVYLLEFDDLYVVHYWYTHE